MTSYALVTPARNEADNLRRLADALAAQTVRPSEWMIVDNGSTDGTEDVARALADELPFVRIVAVAGTSGIVRGAPVVRAFHAGVAALPGRREMVVKLDADTSMDPDYFERLLTAFALDAKLGIAGGLCHERGADGAWEPRRGTSGTVFGATRAYRWECLQDVLPLEERMGWDGIDALKANLRGWRTETLGDLPFRHHRQEGERDGARYRAWIAQGSASYFMGYRAWYLAARALHHMRREPAAVAMLWGYAASALRREPRCADRDVVRYLRDGQRLGSLRARARDVAGADATAG